MSYYTYYSLKLLLFSFMIRTISACQPSCDITEYCDLSLNACITRHSVGEICTQSLECSSLLECMEGTCSNAKNKEREMQSKVLIIGTCVLAVLVAFLLLTIIGWCVHLMFANKKRTLNARKEMNQKRFFVSTSKQNSFPNGNGSHGTNELSKNASVDYLETKVTIPEKAIV